MTSHICMEMGLNRSDVLVTSALNTDMKAPWMHLDLISWAKFKSDWGGSAYSFMLTHLIMHKMWI